MLLGDARGSMVSSTPKKTGSSRVTQAHFDVDRTSHQFSTLWHHPCMCSSIYSAPHDRIASNRVRRQTIRRITANRFVVESRSLLQEWKYNSLPTHDFSKDFQVCAPLTDLESDAKTCDTFQICEATYRNVANSLPTARFVPYLLVSLRNECVTAA